MSFLLSLFSFFFGSIPWGYMIAKQRGVELRKVGSGNIGATNVMRAVGKKEALITLLLDISKGLIPVLIARAVYHTDNSSLLVGTSGILAILGHCYTPFLKFKGGKGVATSIGVILGYMPLVGLLMIVIWIITFKVSRISSLSALVSFGLLPIIVFLLDFPREAFLLTCLISLIVFLRHRENIKRLIEGKESKFGRKDE